MREAIEWRLLRLPLLTLALTLGLAGALLYGAERYEDAAQSEYLRSRARLHGVVALYRTAENDRSLYSQYVARFEDLKRRGVIGAEPRLNWVEALEQVNQDLRLPVLRYEIEPQRPLAFEAQRFDSRILHAFRSTMRFEAGLLHEGDLVSLLDELRRLTNGRFEVRDCEIELSNPARGIVFDPRTANLLARCALDWYTLQIEESAARNDQAS